MTEKWQLPTIKQMQDLIFTACKAPHINIDYKREDEFPPTPFVAERKESHFRKALLDAFEIKNLTSLWTNYCYSQFESMALVLSGEELEYQRFSKAHLNHVLLIRKIELDHPLKIGFHLDGTVETSISEEDRFVYNAKTKTLIDMIDRLEVRIPEQPTNWVHAMEKCDNYDHYQYTDQLKKIRSHTPTKPTIITLPKPTIITLPNWTITSILEDESNFNEQVKIISSIINQSAKQFQTDYIMACIEPKLSEHYDMLLNQAFDGKFVHILTEEIKENLDKMIKEFIMNYDNSTSEIFMLYALDFKNPALQSNY